jgi:hypothetical protein
MFSVVDARALSRTAASDIPEWYITKSGQEPLIGMLSDHTLFVRKPIGPFLTNGCRLPVSLAPYR